MRRQRGIRQILEQRLLLLLHHTRRLGDRSHRRLDMDRRHVPRGFLAVSSTSASTGFTNATSPTFRSRGLLALGRIGVLRQPVGAGFDPNVHRLARRWRSTTEPEKPARSSAANDNEERTVCRQRSRVVASSPVRLMTSPTQPHRGDMEARPSRCCGGAWPRNRNSPGDQEPEETDERVEYQRPAVFRRPRGGSRRRYDRQTIPTRQRMTSHQADMPEEIQQDIGSATRPACSRRSCATCGGGKGACDQPGSDLLVGGAG